MNAAMFGSTQEVVSNKVRFGLVLGLYAVFGCHPQPRGLTAVAANPAFPQECPAKPGATLGQRELVGLPRAQNGLWKLLSAEGDDRLAVGAPFTAAWAQDGSTIIVLTREHITPFDAVTGHEGRSYALSEPASLKFQPVVSANGRYLAVHVECKPGRVEVIDRVRGANWHAETEHGPYTFSDDGTRLVADTHRIWSSESGQELYPDALWSRSRASSYWPDLPLPSGSQRPETEALLVQAAGGGYKELPAPFRVIFPDWRRRH